MQDGQEFFKLLLNLLEAKLAKSSIPVCSLLVSIDCSLFAPNDFDRIINAFAWLIHAGD